MPRKRGTFNAMLLRTDRLFLRKFKYDDYPLLRSLLQDERVMYAYGGAFSDAEVRAWLERQFERYRDPGYGLHAIIRICDGMMVGQCGLTVQRWKDSDVLEAGYMLFFSEWHKGYATEAVKGCISYAYDTLGADEVSAIIRDTNLPSMNVAVRCGMEKRESAVKHYRGSDMLHYRFSCIRE